MTQYGMSRFNILPPVIKNLIIINALMFLAQMAMPVVNENVGLYLFKSDAFRPFQIVTHMFAHGSVLHIFSNMFALWMFGSVLENVWGPKRFLTFYLITGFGAMLLHTGVNYYEYTQVAKHLSDAQVQEVLRNGRDYLLSDKNYSDMYLGKLNLIVNVPSVGASGAIFGVLAAFGLLFPNTLIYIYLLIPMKAKYFILFYIGLEIYLGIQNNPGDNIAHFAHIGGALFGFILVKIWGADKRRFY